MKIVESLRVRRQLTVRLATSAQDIEAAQRLRWQIFYEAMGAIPDGMAHGLDVDPYDEVCDHLLVEDQEEDCKHVIGTYRMLRQSVAEKNRGFYSADEYNLRPVIDSTCDGELLELGRSCVAEDYRDAGTIQLLWGGIASYLRHYRIGAIFGCASFHGTNPDDHAEALSYLFHNHLAPSTIRVNALASRRVDMGMLPLGGYDQKNALRHLPPLIKGYLRVGAMVGDGAVIDHQFNTTDIFLVMPVAEISQRYLMRFGAAA